MNQLYHRGFVHSAEAAFIAGVTQTQMNRMADEHLVPDDLLVKDGSSRKFARLTAACASFFFHSHNTLRAAKRKDILFELTTRVRSSACKDQVMGLQSNASDIDWVIVVDLDMGLQIDFTVFLTKALDRAKTVDVADELVAKVDGIMGGKPCFKGTRLPIEIVLASIDKGISEDRIADEYSLTKEQIQAARVYAQVHPQRGRPVRLGAAKPAVQ